MVGGGGVWVDDGWERRRRNRPTKGRLPSGRLSSTLPFSGVRYWPSVCSPSPPLRPYFHRVPPSPWFPFFFFSNDFSRYTTTKKKEKKNCRSVLSLLSFFSNNFFMFHSVFFVLWVCVRVCVCVFYVEFRASYLLPETFPGCEVAERYFLGSVPFVSFLSIQRSSSTLSSSCFFSSSSSGFDW